MYQTLVIAHVVMIIATMVSTIALARIRGSVEHKYLLLTCVCVDLYTIGYYVELTAENIDIAVTSLGFQYTGLGLASLCYSMFIFNYCKVKIVPPWVWRVLAGYFMIIIALVVTCRHHTYYYSSIRWIEEGLFPHLDLGRSPMFWCFTVMQATLLVISSVVVWFRRKRSLKKNERKQLTFLFVETLIPVLGILATSLKWIEGFDPSPLLLSVMVATMTLTLTTGKLFDITAIAFATMFQNISNGVIIADEDRNYIESNAKAEEIFPILKKWEPGTDMAYLGIDMFMPEREVFFERHDKYYCATYSVLREKDKNIGYIVSISDISEMKHQMEEMRLLKERADSASEAKTMFLANMSHEMRTPLNAIIGMAELASREKTESKLKKYVNQIKSSGLILLEIINDVLDFSKAESGKLELNEGEYDFAELLNNLINITKVRIGDKNVRFFVEINPAIPRNLYGDDIRIKQTILNLLGNAAKYTNEGEIVLDVDYEEYGDEIRLLVSVKDTGIGIKEEDLDKIFSPFQQVDTKKNRKVEGSGLGLSIAKQLIELMKGTYGVESEYGKGSRFYFMIRQNLASRGPGIGHGKKERKEVLRNQMFSINEAEDNTVTKKIAEESGELKFYGKRVLVVDDNTMNVVVAKSMLELYDITAESVLSGKDAIDLVSRKHFDLILMDHMMPGMDGVEATRIIRSLDNEKCKNVPILACTANVIKGVEEMFEEAGMNDIIPKPILPNVLEEKLKKYLS